MESLERQSPIDSPDLTQDLESLYERLKVVIQTIQSPEGTPDSIKKEGADELLNKAESISTISLGGEQSLSEEALASKDDSCGCKVVFSGENKRFCNLCKEPIPIINQLLRDKLKFEDEIENLDELVKSEKEKNDQLLVQNSNMKENLERLEGELNFKEEKMLALEKDLNIINAKYIDEIDKLSEVQHSKALVEHELEDLSRKLFEEANQMVAKEARSRNTAEVAKERLEDEVMQLKSQLFVQSNLNRDLKRKCKQLAPNLVVHSTQESASDPNDNDSDSSYSFDIAVEVPEDEDEILDETQLEQFELFAASCVNSALNKIVQHPFIRRCMEEDIEPCLKFGTNPRIYPRRIIDAITHNTLVLSTANSLNDSPSVSSRESPAIAASHTPPEPDNSPGSSQSQSVIGMWSRWSSAAAHAIASANKQTPLPVNGCHACGQEAPCQYRLQLVERQEPFPIDKFCRDRIAACLEFFNFVTAIRTGQYNTRRIDDLYTESLRLRLRMFYARLGFLPSSGIEIPRTMEYLSSPATHLAPLLEEVEHSESPEWSKPLSIPS